MSFLGNPDHFEHPPQRVAAHDRDHGEDGPDGQVLRQGGFQPEKLSVMSIVLVMGGTGLPPDCQGGTRGTTGAQGDVQTPTPPLLHHFRGHGLAGGERTLGEHGVML